jgi:hypothetical protein
MDMMKWEKQDIKKTNENPKVKNIVSEVKKYTGWDLKKKTKAI